MLCVIVNMLCVNNVLCYVFAPRAKFRLVENSLYVRQMSVSMKTTWKHKSILAPRATSGQKFILIELESQFGSAHFENRGSPSF